MALTVKEEHRKIDFIEMCREIDGVIRQNTDREELLRCNVNGTSIVTNVKDKSVDIDTDKHAKISVKDVSGIYTPTVIVGEDRMCIYTKSGLEMVISESGRVNVEVNR